MRPQTDGQTDIRDKTQVDNKLAKQINKNLRQRDREREREREREQSDPDKLLTYLRVLTHLCMWGMEKGIEGERGKGTGNGNKLMRQVWTICCCYCLHSATVFSHNVTRC